MMLKLKAPDPKFLPTVALGFVFVTLGSCRYLLIKFSAQQDGQYQYLPVTVNVSSELIKFVVCFTLALCTIKSEKRSLKETFCVGYVDMLQGLKWSVPGFLYFCDNLLAFYIIRYLQPAVVVLLGNFVIITTSLLFRVVLRRILTRVQWASLIILFLAIVALSNQSQTSMEHHKHHGVNHLLTDTNSTDSYTAEKACLSHNTYFQSSKNITKSSRQTRDLINSSGSFFTQFHEGHILIFLQCILSSSANIYNEKIFKEGSGMDESIYIQNSKLYFFGVLFNVLTLVIHKIYRQQIITCGFFFGHNIYSLTLILVTGFYGLNVALILKFRDNMFHLMSSQLITVLVICASIYFFDFMPDINFYLLAPIVLLAIYIFNMSKHQTVAVGVDEQHGYRTIRSNSASSDEQELYISTDNMDE